MISFLKKEDKLGFFIRPVDVTFAPGYHNCIADPIDLGTLELFVYTSNRSLEWYIAAVMKMFANARHYNPPGHPAHDEAVRLQRLFVARLEGEDDVCKEAAAGLCMLNQDIRGVAADGLLLLMHQKSGVNAAMS